MPITISGSTGIAGVDGSASTPAVQGTDTNTGIAFPAADTVAVATGGSERMRVDSSGNVGIGTSSPGQKLDVNGVIQTNNDIYLNNATQYKTVGFYHSGTRKSYVSYDNTNNALLVTAEAASSTLIFQTGGNTERARINSGGQLFTTIDGTSSVLADYGCRAWVNFNGTGVVAIRASGNVTSITDNGTGEYTLNFTTALPDANYSIVGSCGTGAAGNDDFNLTTNFNTAPTTTAARVGSQRANSGTATDAAYISVAIFR